MKEKPKEKKKYDRWSLKSAQSDFDKFVETDEFKKVETEYVEHRKKHGFASRGGKCGLDEKLNKCAAPFVDSVIMPGYGSQAKLPGINLSTIRDKWIKKIARRLRDRLEEVVNKIKQAAVDDAEKQAPVDLSTAEEQELPFDEPVIKGPNEREKPVEDTKPCASATNCGVTAEQSGVVDLLLIELRNLVEVIRAQNDILRDAFFVKQGDLKFKNGSPKHVGWSWFRSNHSEFAQIRGLLAQGKPAEDIETAEDLAEELSQEMKGNKEEAQNG